MLMIVASALMGSERNVSAACARWSIKLELLLNQITRTTKQLNVSERLHGRWNRWNLLAIPTHQHSWPYAAGSSRGLDTSPYKMYMYLGECILQGEVSTYQNH
jgi:hypothetical protein